MTQLKDAVLGMPLNGAIEHYTFNLIAEGRQLLDIHIVIHALHDLLDDRPFVQVGADVMRCGADACW